MTDSERLPPPPRLPSTALSRHLDRQRRAWRFLTRSAGTWLCWIGTVIFALRYSSGTCGKIGLIGGLLSTTGTLLSIVIVLAGLKIPEREK